MRTLRPLLLTAARIGGATALAGALLPGVAGATAGPAETIGVEHRATVTATATDECAVDFALDTADDADWVVDYRVDDEEPTAGGGGGSSSLYNPVVTNRQHVADTLNSAEQQNYLVGVDEATADLRGYGSGTHTVTFTLRSGPGTDGGTAQAATGAILVDCFSEHDPSAVDRWTGPDPAEVFGDLITAES